MTFMDIPNYVLSHMIDLGFFCSSLVGAFEGEKAEVYNNCNSYLNDTEQNMKLVYGSLP